MIKHACPQNSSFSFNKCFCLFFRQLEGLFVLVGFCLSTGGSSSYNWKVNISKPLRKADKEAVQRSWALNIDNLSSWYHGCFGVNLYDKRWEWSMCCSLTQRKVYGLWGVFKEDTWESKTFTRVYVSGMCFKTKEHKKYTSSRGSQLEVSTSVSEVIFLSVLVKQGNMWNKHHCIRSLGDVYGQALLKTKSTPHTHITHTHTLPLSHETHTLTDLTFMIEAEIIWTLA